MTHSSPSLVMLLTTVLTLSFSVTAFAGQHGAPIAYCNVLNAREGQILTRDVFNATFGYYPPGLYVSLLLRSLTTYLSKTLGEPVANTSAPLT